MDQREQRDRAIDALPLLRPRIAHAGSFHAPLVGRQPEFDRLHAAWREVQGGGGMRVIRLTGPAGSGKTRLIQAFAGHLEQEGRPLIRLQASAGRSSEGRPYALLRDLLFDFLGVPLEICEAGPPQTACQLLLSGITDFIGPQHLETAHWLGHLAGFDLSTGPYLAGRLDDPYQARQLAFAALARFFQGLASRSPVLILLDDLQSAAPDFLDGLDGLLAQGADAPILVLLAARPELWQHRPAWGDGWPGSVALPLAPLPAADSRRLAAEMLAALFEPAANEPSEQALSWLADRLVERSRGNPQQMQETLSALLEASRLPPEPRRRWLDQWNSAGASPQALAEAQVQLLSPAERLLCQRAAIFGRVFWEAALCSESPPSEGALAVQETLSELCRRGLLERRPASAFTGTAEYAFLNDLVLQKLVGQLVPAARKAEHGRAAAWLAERAGDPAQSPALAIAAHYEQAGEPLSAAEWYHQAAQTARRASAPATALHAFQRALDNLPASETHLPLRVHLYKSLWDVQWWHASFHNALTSAQTLLDEAETFGDRVAQAAAWNRIGAIQSRQGDYHQALRSLQRAERLGRAANAASEVTLALFSRGLTLYRLGDESVLGDVNEQAADFHRDQLGRPASGELDLRTAQHAARLARRTGRLIGDDLLRSKVIGPLHASQPPGQPAAGRGSAYDHETARVLSLLALSHLRMGRYAQAAQDYASVLAIYRALEDTPGMVAALNNLGVNANLQGDFAGAWSHHREALELADRLGNEELRLVCACNLAGALVELGEFAQAEDGLRDILRRRALPELLAAERADWVLESEVYRFLTLACLGQGRTLEALESGLRSLAVARRRGTLELIGRAWRALGRVAAAGVPVCVDEQLYGPHACYGASLQVFVELGSAVEQARTAREWAAYQLVQDDPREGARLWREARDLFARLGLSLEVERMKHARPDLPA